MSAAAVAKPEDEAPPPAVAAGGDGLLSFIALMAKYSPPVEKPPPLPQATSAAPPQPPPEPVKPDKKKVKSGASPKAGDKRKRDADLDVKGCEGKDTRESDRKLLLKSKVIAEEKSANKTHISDAYYVKDDKSWITSDQMNSALCHQIKWRIKKGFWPESATWRVLHPQPWATVVKSFSTHKHPLNICVQTPTPVDYIFLPVNVGLSGSATDKGNHWVMLFIDSVRRIVSYWDPFGTPLIRDTAYAKLRAHFHQYEFDECTARLQADGFQCGVWVIFGLVRCYLDVSTGWLKDNPNARFDPTRSCKTLPVRAVDLSLPVHGERKYSLLNNGLVECYRTMIAERMRASINSGKFTLADLEMD